MDKRKKQVLTVLGIGSVVLVWRVYVICTKYLPASASAQPQAAIAAPAIAPPVPPGPVHAGGLTDAALAARIQLQNQVAARSWGRDPFEGITTLPDPEGNAEESVRRVAVQAPPAPQMKIVGVSALGDDWIAAMNGNVYRVDDKTAEGFNVRRITRNAVTLESDGWEYVYTLGVAEPRVARIDNRDD